MAKHFILLTIFLVINISSSIACSMYEHEKKGKAICEIKKGDAKVTLYYFKSGCEFPEGQKNNCIYSIACKGKRTYRGTPILKGKKSLKALCLTADKINGNLIKNLFSHPGINTSVDLDCSSIAKKPIVKLQLTNSVQTCDISDFAK